MNSAHVVDVFASSWGAACLRIELATKERIDFSIFWDHSRGAGMQHSTAAINAAHAAVVEWERLHAMFLGDLLLAARDRVMATGEPDPSERIGPGEVIQAEQRDAGIYCLVSTRIGAIETIVPPDLSRLHLQFPASFSEEECAVIYGSCYQAICEAVLGRGDWAVGLGVDPVLLASERALAAAARARTAE